MEDVFGAAPVEVVGGGEVGGAEEVEEKELTGGGAGAVEDGVEGGVVEGVEGAAEGDDVGAGVEGLGIGEEIGLEDGGAGEVFLSSGVGELGNGFDAGAGGELHPPAEEVVDEVGAAAAGVEDGAVGEVDEAHHGVEAGGLGVGAGPEEGREVGAVSCGGAVVGVEVFGRVAHRRVDDRLKWRVALRGVARTLPCGQPLNLVIDTLEGEMTPLWRDILRDALAVEYGTAPWIATLASVDLEGRPRARTVILRRVDEEGRAWVISSAQSDKNGQLRGLGFAELVVYLPGRREQFRLAGRVRVLGEAEGDGRRGEMWASISDAARATFFWPTIGKPVSGCGPVVESVGASTPMPASFEMIVLSPDRVEHLTTARLPHVRTRWREETGWEAEGINP